MATQTVIPAPLDIYRDSTPTTPPADSPRPNPASRIKHLRSTLGLVAFFATVAAVEASVPRYRHLLWTLIYPAVSITAAAVFNYLRAFHPGRVPKPLEYGVPLRVKLNRIKKALGWTALLTTLLGVAALAFNSCTCEDHPALFITWMVTMIGSYVGFLGLAAYLAARTVAPRRRATSTSGRRSLSDYKPFHSEHWGNAGEASRPPATQIPGSAS